jgi:cytochrome c oxidase assembly protein subunit 15
MKSMRPVGIWMLCLAALVVMMAVIGAVTRLTDSGLSIVDWELVGDILPPMSDAAWNHDFQIYQTTPQYHYITHGMTLAQYKHIFFWEWLHRLWARAVLGTALFVPFAIFAAKGYINRRVMRMLGVVFALAAFQGFMGWYMVRSGLEQRPSVSHYRLAAHLVVALLIYASLLWDGLSLLYPIHLMRGSIDAIDKLKKHAAIGLGLIALTMIWGAFVAGLRAGLMYNTFPLMGGHIVPSEWLYYQPAWINFFMNPATVQFTHRCLAITTGITLLVLVYRTWKVKLPESAQTIAMAIGFAVPAQIVLGISTLLHHVPVWMGALHQAGAITVLTLVIAFLFVLRKPRGGTILEKVLEPSRRPQSGMAPSTPNMQSPGSTTADR